MRSHVVIRKCTVVLEKPAVDALMMEVAVFFLITHNILQNDILET